MFQLVAEKVPKIDCPWMSDEGDLSFVPTRVKWIETLSNNKPAKKKAKEEAKKAKKTKTEEKAMKAKVQET